MKRWIALWLAAAVLISLTACSMKINTQAPTTEPATADPNAYPRVKVTAVEAKETLTDDAGNAVITIESRIPKLTAGLEEGMLNMFNYQFESLLTEMRSRAERNRENAAADLKRSGSGTPWLFKMDFTQTYADAGFLGIVLIEQFSTLGDPRAEPTYHTKMLDLTTGRVCPASQFSYDGADSDLLRGQVEALLLTELQRSYRVNGAKVPEDQLQATAASYDDYTYWFMPDGELIFPLDRSIVGEAGFYLCRLSAAAAQELFFTPLEYRTSMSDN